MRVNKRITVAAGTPVNVATGTIAAGPNPVYARSVSIQMKTGGSGLGYVMDGIYGGRVPSAAKVSDLTQELYPASDATPGGVYSDWDQTRAAGIDVNALWVDGNHTGDVILASFDQII